MFASVFSAPMCVPHAYTHYLKKSEEGIGSLEWQLWMVVNHHVLGNKLRSSALTPDPSL